MRWVAVLLLLAGCMSSEWVREHRGYLPGTDGHDTAVLLIRDKRTGRPIQGAVVRQHQEATCSEDGRWAPLVAEGRTDRYGLVSFLLPERPGPCHWTVDAREYAPTEEYGGRIQRDVDMEPGWELAGRLLGPLGEPLRDVEVEYKTGCAHAPPLRTTHTDQNGLFVFENVISGDITFEDPRFEADYWTLHPARPRRWGVATQQVLPEGTVRGRLLRADGTPADGAVVQSYTSSRGPRAVVDENGSFVLRGVRLTAKLFLMRVGGAPPVDLREYRPGGPILIRLGEQSEEEEPLHEVKVTVTDMDGEPPEKLCDVFLDRVEDGRRFSGEWSPWDDRPATFWVEKGDYLLSVGEPKSPYVADARPLSVSGATTATIRARRQPRLEVDLPQLAGDPIGAVRVLLKDRHWEVEPGDPEYPVYLPADEEAWLRVDMAGAAYTFPIQPVKDGVRRAHVRLPGLKRIVFPALAMPYQANLMYAWRAEVELEGFEDSEDPRPLATYVVGKQWIVVRHEQHGRVTKLIDLPWSASKPIEVRDLDFVRHPEPRELRVVDEEGNPVAGADIWVLDDPSPPGYDWVDWRGEEQTDERGLFLHPLLCNGTHIRIDRADHIPSWAQLRRKPPYEVRVGSATLELELKDLPEASVVFDGQVWRRADEDGMVMIRGISAGTHHLLVGAKDHFGLVWRLHLKPSELRRIKPVLRPRSTRRDQRSLPSSGIPSSPMR